MVKDSFNEGLCICGEPVAIKGGFDWAEQVGGNWSKHGGGGVMFE